MDELFDSMIGGEDFSYQQTESKDCIITASSQPASHQKAVADRNLN